MTQPFFYIHLKPDQIPAEMTTSQPCRMIVIIEAPVSQDSQNKISDWIARSGCLVMMAWGLDCSTWDDSVDMANIAAFDFGDIPEDKFIMTTWHSNDSLADMFWYAKNLAEHPKVTLEQTVLLHIAEVSQERELLDAYAAT